MSSSRPIGSLAAVVTGLQLPLTLLSGILLPLSLAPGWMVAVAHANPLWCAVEVSRDLWAAQIATGTVAAGTIVAAGLTVLAVGRSHVCTAECSADGRARGTRHLEELLRQRRQDA